MSRTTKTLGPAHLYSLKEQGIESMSCADWSHRIILHPLSKVISIILWKHFIVLCGKMLSSLHICTEIPEYRFFMPTYVLMLWH